MSQSQLLELPTDLIRSALRETLEKKLKSTDYQIDVSSVSEVGENNFMGEIFRASFNKKSGDESKSCKDQTHKLFIKTAPQDVLFRDRCFSRPSFLREIYIYDEVLPAFRRFEQSKGVARENGFNEYPNCYRTVNTESSESLFLEDLSVRGFVMVDRYTKDITVEHVLLLMRSLAKFHAISFAMKDQQPRQFNELTSSMDEVWLNIEDKDRWNHFTKQSQHLKNVLSREEDAHLLGRVEKLLEVEVIAANCIDSKITGCAVISHGDMWQNNLMFRYNDSGNPIEISLFDWQISRYSSPIIDIVYFIFCSTTKELRDKHYDDFLNVYHTTLSTHIRKLGSDPEKLFSHGMMQEQLHKFGKFGMFIAALMLQMITKDAGNRRNHDTLAKKSTDTSTFGTPFISDNSRGKFESRLRDVIIDMARLEYI